MHPVNSKRSSQTIALVVACGFLVLLAARSNSLGETLRRNYLMVDVLPRFASANASDHFRAPCTCTANVEGLKPATPAAGQDDNELLDAGRALYYEQNYAETIAVLSQAAPSSMARPLIDFFLGASYICLDDGAKAAEYWSEEETAWRAFRGIQQCLRAGEDKRAATLYDLALAIDPTIAETGYPPSAATFAHYQGASAVARARDLPQVELRWLQLGVEKHPDLALANTRLGQYYERAGETARANEHYGRALEQDPADPALYQQYIRTSFALANWRAGAKAIERYLIEVQGGESRHLDRLENLIQSNLNPDLCRELSGLRSVDRGARDENVRDAVSLLRQLCADGE